MDEVNDDRDLDIPFASFGLDLIDLVIVAVHQRDPRELAVGIAPVGLVEHLGDTDAKARGSRLASRAGRELSDVGLGSATE